MLTPVSDLRVTLFQTDLFWENPAANRQNLETKIRSLTEPTDLLILPEMFSTGFTMNAPALAESMDGPTIQWLQQMAQLKQAAITGSLIIKEAGHYYNRLVWVQPDGQIFTYDKRHLFRMAQENGIYSAGKTRLLVNWKGWNICPLVCYDLRFPVWSRQHTNPPYDLLLYVANWPAKRAAAWKALLPARAIENLSYCIGVNRTGQDTQQIEYSGDSTVCSPQGNIQWLPAQTEAVQTFTLSYPYLQNFRERFPANLDADNFEIML